MGPHKNDPIFSVVFYKAFLAVKLWDKTSPIPCSNLQMTHHNMGGFTRFASNPSLTIKKPQKIELQLCVFQDAA